VTASTEIRLVRIERLESAIKINNSGFFQVYQVEEELNYLLDKLRHCLNNVPVPALDRWVHF
jgi:hypothetical protein